MGVWVARLPTPFAHTPIPRPQGVQAMRTLACLLALSLALGCGRAASVKPKAASSTEEQLVQQFLSSLLDTLNAKDGLKQLETRLAGRLPVPEVSQILTRLKAVQGASSVQIVELTKQGAKAFRAKAAFTRESEKAELTLLLTFDDGSLRLVGIL